jgi:ABC-type antimicrobial peptide transport system permease subunit
MALGARRSDVLGLILGQSMILTAAGTVLGVLGTAATTRYLQGMLFGLTAFDAPTFLAVIALFAVVAAVASYLPARRATKVDPLIALHCE